MNQFKKRVVECVAIAVIGVMLVYGAYEDGVKRQHPDHIILTKDNLVVLDGEINQNSVAKVQSDARALKGCPIYLYIDSPGGYIAYGLELIDMLKGLRCPVKTLTRNAASMAFETVQNLDERLVFPNATLMAHHPTGSFSGEFGGKQPAQIDHRLLLSVQQWEELDIVTVARTKGKYTLKTYQEAYDHELWLTAKQAVANGFADRIVTAECDASLDGGTVISSQMESSPFVMEKSYCPLISGPVLKLKPLAFLKDK